MLLEYERRAAGEDCRFKDVTFARPQATDEGKETANVAFVIPTQRFLPSCTVLSPSPRPSCCVESWTARTPTLHAAYARLCHPLMLRIFAAPLTVQGSSIRKRERFGTPIPLLFLLVVRRAQKSLPSRSRGQWKWITGLGEQR